MLFVICLAVAGAGLALEVLFAAQPQMSIIASLGAAAAIGAGAAAFAALAARLAQAILARKRAEAEQGERP